MVHGESDKTFHCSNMQADCGSNKQIGTPFLPLVDQFMGNINTEKIQINGWQLARFYALFKDNSGSYCCAFSINLVKHSFQSETFSSPLTTYQHTQQKRTKNNKENGGLRYINKVLFRILHCKYNQLIVSFRLYL